MQKSEHINELAAALAKAQGVMTPAALNSVNPFLKNRFADLGSIVEAARKPLADNGLSFVQFPTGDPEAGLMGVQTMLMHSSGQWLAADPVYLPMGEEKGKSSAQVAGSVITYLRRYSLASALGIYADEDDDGQAVKVAPRPAVAVSQREPSKPTPKIVETDSGRVNVATGEVTVTEPKTTLPPVDVGPLSEGIHVPSKDNTQPLVTPPAPLWALVERARQNGAAFKSAESEESGRGLMVDRLDEYAGDTHARHSFLIALFPYSNGHSKLVSAPDKRALLKWLEAPDAKSEVQGVIRDYLKAQGQQEMVLAA